MGRGASLALLVLSSGCLGSSEPAQVFYGARYEVEGRGELISFAAEDPSDVRVLVGARDEQYFGEPCWRLTGDAFDIVRELDGEFTIERVTTEWVSVETRIELGALSVANRKLHRSPSGEQLYLLTSDDTRKHLSRVDPQGQMSEVVDLALFGITAPEHCDLSVLSEQRVSINCLGAGGNSPLLTIVETGTGNFDTYWTEMAGYVGNIAWAPDGMAFAFCMGMPETDTGYATWLVQVAEGLPLANNPAVEIGVGCPQAWSPDSRRLVTNSQVFDLDSEDPTLAEHELTAGEYTKRSQGDASLFRFSPDSTRLAYGEGSAYVLSLETLEEFRYELQLGEVFEPPPVWSADGAYLYRGSCAEVANAEGWDCGGNVFTVDELLAGCPEDEGDVQTGRQPCAQLGPGVNGSSSVPPVEG